MRGNRWILKWNYIVENILLGKTAYEIVKVSSVTRLIPKGIRQIRYSCMKTIRECVPTLRGKETQALIWRLLFNLHVSDGCSSSYLFGINRISIKKVAIASRQLSSIYGYTWCSIHWLSLKAVLIKTTSGLLYLL